MCVSVCEEWTLNVFQLQEHSPAPVSISLEICAPPAAGIVRVCACADPPTPRVHTHARVCARPCMSYSDRDIYTRGRRLSCGICLFLVRYSEYVTQITILLSVPPFILLIRIIPNFARFVAPPPRPPPPSRPVPTSSARCWLL